MSTDIGISSPDTTFKKPYRGFIFPAMEWLKEAVANLGLRDPPAPTPMDVEEGRNPLERFVRTQGTAVTPRMMEEGEQTPMPQAAAQGGETTPVIAFHGGDAPVAGPVSGADVAGKPVYFSVDISQNKLYQKRMQRRRRQQAAAQDDGSQ